MKKVVVTGGAGFIGSNLVDTLIDDLNILPSEKEINKYLDDVDDLKSRTDQLYKKYKNVK